MRLSFLLLALVAAATAIPQLRTTPGTVEVLKKQRDVLILLDQVFQDVRDNDLLKMCREYDIVENLHMYHDQAVVKYLIRSFNLRRFQPKGVPFTFSVSELRKELSVLTRTLLTAKDYITFLKTAAWIRCTFNEAQFVSAFITAVLQRGDTKDIVLPPAYEIFPYYYFDTRVIREAQDIRARIGCRTEKITEKVIHIPVKYFAWLPKDEKSLRYFTQDIGLNAYYTYFNLAGWMLPKTDQTTDEFGIHNYDIGNREIGRGSLFYYMHQQLIARYGLERSSNNLCSVKDIDWACVRTPFKPHLSYPNGLDFPGRGFDFNLVHEKKDLVKTVWRLEKRLRDMIDSGYYMTPQGSILSLYDKKGLDILGNLIEGTGRSINPRYFGSLQGVARELLGGSIDNRYISEPMPSALEIGSTATRDPVFYELFNRIIRIFKRYQDALPIYKQDDLVFPGVRVEDVQFDELTTFSEKFNVDIDSATYIPVDKEIKENIKIKAVVDRLNHKKYTYKIIVDSDKVVKGAVVRVYIGPKYDCRGSYVDIHENRLSFVELDQFIWNLNVGKTIIVRKSGEAPMYSNDVITKDEIFRKVEDALDAHQPFYRDELEHTFGFPERLALPKGKRDGLPLQVVVIVSSPTKKTMTYGPMVSRNFQTYQKVDFEDFVHDYTKDSLRGKSYIYRDIRTTGDIDYTNRRLDVDSDIETRTRHLTNLRENARRITRLGIQKIYRDTDETTNIDDTMATKEKYNYLLDYYKDKKIYEKIGGFVSLDGRPLGFPLDRPLAMECLWIPNLKVIDVKVFWEGEDTMEKMQKIEL